MNRFYSDDTIEDDLTMRLTGNYRKNFTKSKCSLNCVHFDWWRPFRSYIYGSSFCLNNFSGRFEKFWSIENLFKDMCRKKISHGLEIFGSWASLDFQAFWYCYLLHYLLLMVSLNSNGFSDFVDNKMFLMIDKNFGDSLKMLVAESLFYSCC